MVNNHSRKNAARQRSAATGESHQTATGAVRQRASLIPDPPTPDELLAEGRAKICEALSAMADQESRPRLREFLNSLVRDVQASQTGADLYVGRANFAYRRADNYYREQWDRVSADPPASYEEHLAGINGAYWARRVTYEWRWPGQWDKTLRG